MVKLITRDFDQPEKLNDDLMDATRYALHTMERRGQVKLYI
jgi:hypothetical protein